MKKIIIVLLLFIPMLTSCKKEDVGEIYSLDYAYENNLISDAEILQIAYTYNSTHYDGEVDYGENFVPQEVNTDRSSLDDDIVRKIKQAYYNEYPYGEEKENVEVIFTDFYGKYNDYYVVELYYRNNDSICGESGDDKNFSVGLATFYGEPNILVYKK